jgi:hypothetical protein
MPAQRPRAAFEPIPPDLDVAALVESTPNFEYVIRIHCNSIDEHGLDNFDKLVRLHVILGGKPLVIEGFHERLDRSVFSEKWLRSHHSTKSKSTSLVMLSRTYEFLSNLRLAFQRGDCSKFDHEEQSSALDWPLLEEHATLN